MLSRLCLGCWLTLVSGTWAWAGELEVRHSAAMSISIEGVRPHLNFLADDTLEGRESGSRGGRAAAGYIIEELQQFHVKPAASADSFYQSFPPNSNNLLGKIEGSDPKLKDQYIVIGAHYDHVGYGTPTNSFGPIGKIHNGADDNASGVCGLLEIVKAISQLPQPPRRSILIAFWDGEEKGLLGSKYWIDHPTIPLNQIPFSFNIDMIGRLRNSRVQVLAWRSAPGLRKMLVQQNEGSSLELNFDWEMKANSDHWTFLSHRIPTLMLFTGLHEDYHRPSDDIEKVNQEGVQDVSRLLFLALMEMANADQLPHFRPAALKENTKAQPKIEQLAPPMPSRLGIGWDPVRANQGEIVVTSIDTGSAAAAGKLQVGDQIIRFAGQEIASPQTMRASVASATADCVALVRREGSEEPVEVNLHLAGQPVRVGVQWRIDESEPDCVSLTAVVPGSPAERAGLKLWDRVYQIGNQPIASSEDFTAKLNAAHGSTDLLVETLGQLHHVELQLAP